MFFSPGPPAWPESPPDAPVAQVQPLSLALAPLPVDAGLSLPLDRVTVVSPQHPHHAPVKIHRGHDPALVRQAVAHQASRRVGSSARLYYPQRPRLACASFVSKVLTLEHLLPRKIAAVGALKGALLHRGWQLNCPYGTSVTHVARRHLQAGDVLLFHRRGGSLRHSGISLGGDRFVAISSSRRRVALWRLSDYAYVYPDFESLRYGP